MQNVQLNENWRQALQINDVNNEQHELLLSDNESDSEIEQESCEMLIQRFTKSINIHKMQDKMIEIAPAQNQYPVGIFQDKNAEEMNFSTLFYGCPRDKNIINNFSYQKITQWELCHSKRHFAYHKTIFFSSKQ